MGGGFVCGKGMKSVEGDHEVTLKGKFCLLSCGLVGISNTTTPNPVQPGLTRRSTRSGHQSGSMAGSGLLA